MKLDLFVGFPSYGGNGGISSECPSVRDWYTRLRATTVPNLRSEGRLGAVHDTTIADTPITMVRNKFVTLARRAGAHLLLTIDSDMNPDLHRNEPWFRPFFETAFDAIYEHYHKGPLVIGAPYCGPPSDQGGENVYVFQFENRGWHGDYSRIELSQYTRCEAEKMAGVSEVAALPTGFVLYDMRIFDLLEPSSLTKEQVLTALLEGRMTKVEALAALTDGWFFYEWKNQYADEKGSTEDVAATRDMAFAGMANLGYNPLRCAWDSWAGHYKPWCVGKPRSSTVEHISAGFRRAIEQDNSLWEEERDFSGQWLDREVNFISPFPSEFPMELTKDIDDEAMKHFSRRDVFGAEIMMFMHITPTEHLKGLRQLVRTEYGRRKQKLRIVEIGSWLGDSAIALADPECVEWVHCFDTWEGSSSDATKDLKDMLGCSDTLYDIFYWNIKHARSQIELAEIRSTRQASADAAIEFEDGFSCADIIFIDADHTYEGCKADIEAWLPQIHSDGVMIGHDYGTPQFPGVDKAVQEIFGESVQEYCHIPQKGACWLVFMKDFSKADFNGRKLMGSASS